MRRSSYPHPTNDIDATIEALQAILTASERYGTKLQELKNRLEEKTEMAKETLLTRTDEHLGEGIFDSIAWAFSEHVGTEDTGVYNSALLYGNEDAPEMIEFYTQAEPKVTDTVAYRWVSSRDDENA